MYLPPTIINTPSHPISYHIQCTTDHKPQLNSQLQLCSYIMMHLLITHKSRSLIHDHPAHQKLELEFQIPQTFSRILYLHQITSQSTLCKCIRTPRPSRGNVYPGGLVLGLNYENNIQYKRGCNSKLEVGGGSLTRVQVYSNYRYNANCRDHPPTQLTPEIHIRTGR